MRLTCLSADRTITSEGEWASCNQLQVLIENDTSRLKWEFCQQIAFRLEIQCQLLPGSTPVLAPVTWRNRFLPRVPSATIHGDAVSVITEGAARGQGSPHPPNAQVVPTSKETYPTLLMLEKQVMRTDRANMEKVPN